MGRVPHPLWPQGKPLVAPEGPLILASMFCIAVGSCVLWTSIGEAREKEKLQKITQQFQDHSGEALKILHRLETKLDLVGSTFRPWGSTNVYTNQWGEVGTNYSFLTNGIVVNGFLEAP